MKRKDDEPIQAKMGRAGETIVSNWFIKKGYPVTASVDQYDSSKDMIIGGQRVEVKTQVPFVNKDAFSFRDSQLKKCKNADMVFFVSVPAKTKDHFSYGKVYCVESKNMEYTTYLTKDNRRMILVPINQSGMIEVFTMTQEEQEILNKYSISDWK